MGTFLGAAPEDKCEWRSLAPFISELNRVSGFNYRLVLCLDVADRRHKQPEILVRDRGSGLEAVVERKIIAWPVSYLEAQRNDERLSSALLDRFAPLFAGAPYRLEILSSIAWQRPYRRNAILDQLALQIEYARLDLDYQDRVDGTFPIPWVLYRIDPTEKEDEDMPDEGLVVLVNQPGDEQVLSQYPRFLHKIKSRLVLLLESANSKFVPHKGRTRILVLEPYGPDLVDETVRQLVPTLEVPPLIDQLWLTSPDWTTWPPGRDYERLR